MGGLSQLTAAGHTVVLAGRTYHLNPLTLADYGEIENRILAGRPDPREDLRRRLAALDAAEQEQELARVYDQAAVAGRVTLGDLDQWWQTPAAFAFRFWLMIRGQHPQVELEEAAAIVEGLPGEKRNELVRRMEDCHGLPAGQRACGPAGGGEAAACQAELPWWRWACRLSRRYGWTPGEIGRLTLAANVDLSDRAVRSRRSAN